MAMEGRSSGDASCNVLGGGRDISSHAQIMAKAAFAPSCHLRVAFDQV